MSASSSATSSELSPSVISDGSTREGWDYVLICSNGSSGGKRLLSTLDHSPHTHCRNEPYNNQGSPFRPLREFPRGWVLASGQEADLERDWDRAVAWTAARQGDRDFMPSPPKAHDRGLARSLGLLNVLASRRARRLLSTLSPALAGDEWPLPWWAGNRETFRQARLVMKFNQSPALVRWVLENRPRVKVVHLVRHPAGCLNSWHRRHLANNPDHFVLKNNLHRLRVVAEVDAAAAGAFGDIDRMTLENGGLDGSELLYWWYAVTTVHRSGEGRRQYTLIRDEDMLLDAAGTARRLYEACGLEWTGPVDKYVESRAQNWARSSAIWTELVPETIQLKVRNLLEGSEIESFWESDQRVSRVDYSWI